jgi:hypothetical protein
MSPVGLVKPFRTQMRAPRLKVASRYRGGPEIPGVIPKRGSKTMVDLARSGAGRNLFLTLCVSEASVVVEGRRF